MPNSTKEGIRKDTESGIDAALSLPKENAMAINKNAREVPISFDLFMVIKINS